MYYGAGDAAISVEDTVRYMKALKAKMVDPDGFARLFLVPGMGHCHARAGLSEFDVLHHLVAWVEQGQAPQRLVATGPGLDGRTRPLCVYPKVARYDGSGPKDRASSSTCR